MTKIRKNVKATCMHVKGGEIELREFNGRLCITIDMLDGRTKPSEIELTGDDAQELKKVIKKFILKECE